MSVVKNKTKRRISNNKTNPFTIRLTDAERAALTDRAGAMALGSYIKAVLFADGEKNRHRGARSPVADHAALAQVLACLGSSGIADNVQALADAAESGVLSLDESAPAALRQAADDICVMRLLLMRALGFHVEDLP